MKFRLFVLALLAFAPLGAAEAQSWRQYQISPRDLPRQPSNVAGTTPQRIERRPSFGQRFQEYRARLRDRYDRTRERRYR
jgi:hypothetical protein